MEEEFETGEYMDFEKLKSRVKHSRVRDWEKYDNPKDLAIAISVEVGELLDVFRWLHEDDMGKIRENAETRERIKNELEVVIDKCRQLAGKLGIELDR